jgi:uncharacterized protein (DUF983 family)
LSVFRCPRCGKGRLFSGWLTLAPACAECGLSYSGHEQGDGPAFFAILIIGALAGIFSAIVEIKFAPPFWLHAALWIPFVVVGSVTGLRLMKAALIAAQYRLRKDDFS